jgi:hypothetical protein
MSETALVTRGGLEKLQLACEVRHLGCGHYPPFDGPLYRSQRLRVFPIRTIDLRRAGIGGLNLNKPNAQQIPRIPQRTPPSR